MNLAPLSTRRDIANLGIIFRSFVRRGPKQLQQLFRPAAPSFTRSSPRFRTHSFQVEDATRQLHRDYLDRSTFGYVAIFNLLPECVFQSVEYQWPIPVKEFQGNLNKLLKLCSIDEVYWANLFSPRFELHNHLLRDYRNVDYQHLFFQS